jgi:hypothetical protein
MKIENAEVTLLKASQIEDGDVLLVRMSKKFRDGMNADKAQALHTQLSEMVGEKKIGVYFFPKDLDISVIKGFLGDSEKKFSVDAEGKTSEPVIEK